MRKLFWLALGLGAVELLKRSAAKRGITPTALLSNLAARAVGDPKTEPSKPSTNNGF
jgi:hypothetical protein